MKTMKLYVQPCIKMIQMGNSGEFFMESGPGANDQIDPTKDGNSAKGFGDNTWSNVWGMKNDEWDSSEDVW